jgi:nucleotide-binding universal stress UspA family protein
MPDNRPTGPALIAYDGSSYAQAAIEQAAGLLPPGMAALVVTVWQPLQSIPFAQLAVIPEEIADAMMSEARSVAAEGAERARAAGFDASPLAVEGTPVWHRLVEVADEKDAAIIVIGSHGRSGVRYAVMGSVATAVAQHAHRPVLVGRMADGPPQ